MFEFTSIYCDFDGTITKKDTVNSFFEQYADERWLESEKLWIEGKISSKENAINQVSLLPDIEKKELDDFIDTIEIDEFFMDFYSYVKSKNIPFTILSDGFDLFIEKTLLKHNISDIPFFANHIELKNKRLNISFPNYFNNCKISSGMCKCNKVKENKFCYIGDGTSDLCIAKKSNFLFAKNKLKKYCVTNFINFYSFENFSDIIKLLNDK